MKQDGARQLVEGFTRANLSPSFPCDDFLGPEARSIDLANSKLRGALAYLALITLLPGILFLCLARYPDEVIVSGVVQPDKGVATVVAPRAGTITRILAHEGDSVSAGDLLMDISSDTAAAIGPSSTTLVTDTLKRQKSELLSKQTNIDASAAIEQSSFQQQISSLAKTMDKIMGQISLQHEIVATAKHQLDVGESVAKLGFLSGRELDARKNNYLTQQQQLIQLQQTLEEKKSLLNQLEQSSSRARADGAVALSQASSDILKIDQQLASLSGEQSFGIRAPVSGKIGNLAFRVGQVVSMQQRVLDIVPRRSLYEVELQLPPVARGFVTAGQPVKVAVDSFPYQTYGSLDGHIISVATTPQVAPSTNGVVTYSYIAYVRLQSSSFDRYGLKYSLLPGMTVNAHITTRDLTLIEWVLQPLYAHYRS